ncbi:hypothetical protein ACF0H5_016518 [Mactra antiquata]
MGLVTPIVGVANYLVENPWILALLFLLYCFIYALSIMFSGPKPGRNPFSTKHVRPAKPVITDQSLRNKILKQRFKAQKVPDNIDTIVIGSGMSGLSTAVILGRAGYKVLVLEQHDQAGGCCHTFIDKGFEFDTGIHYIGKMMDGDMTRVLTDQMTEGQVTWCPMDPEFDIVAIGDPEKARKYTMLSGGKDKFAKHLEEYFPSEKVAIGKLMKALEEGKGAFWGVLIPKILPLWLSKIAIKTGIYHLVMRKFIKMSTKTFRSFLDDITDNEEFKAVIGYIFGDMGVVPSELSVLTYSTLINHYIPGAYYPVGGSSEIAFQMIPIIERYGGRVLVDAPISEILVNDKGRAHGVRVRRNNVDTDLFARRIISSAGVINTFKYLLPQEIAVKSPLHRYITEIGPSIGCLTTFVGIDGNSAELGLPKANMWAFLNVDYERDLEEYKNLTPDEASERECPLMFLSFPSAKDPTWEEKFPGKSVVLLITLCPWEWFKSWENGRVKHRGDDYNTIKERIGRQMWRQCEQLFPAVEGRLEYMDVGTPLSNKYYLGQPEGEMYGMNHSMNRFDPELSMYLRPQTGIPGLYLTGQDVLTASFSGAMHSGLLTASAILHRNLFNDLIALTKETRKLNKDPAAKKTD